MDNRFPGLHQSYWMDSVNWPEHSPLMEDITVDVVIVGGGMTGITTALLLKQEGLKVAVLEAGRILSGTTGHTTAKITSQHGLIYNHIRQQLGNELARQYAEANETAIRFIHKLVDDYEIDCDFSWQQAYVYTKSEDYIQKIAAETEAATQSGIKATYLENIPLPIEVKAAIRFERQAQFHPLKYLSALSSMISGDGSHIFEKTRAVDVEEGNPLTTVTTTNGKKVHGKYLIIASHFPFYDGLGFYFARMYQSRSYLMGIKSNLTYPGGMYLSAEEPTRSVRCQSFKDGEMIIVGGEHHKTGHGEDTQVHYQNILDFAHEYFNPQEILYRWSAQDCTTLDKVPYAGLLRPEKPHILVATGFRKWGMTNSTASAILLRDLVLDRDNPWCEVYDPSRLTSVYAAGKFISQNADVAYRYVSGKLALPPKDAPIATGEGKIMEVDGQKSGVFKDEDGILHAVDITCPHLGCELAWNSAENTWDCPCHGSRYTYKGEIVEGPTHNPLHYVTEGPNVIDPNIL